MLNAYLQRTQLYLGDASQIRFNVEDLTNYINEARQQISLMTQCVRFLKQNNFSTVTSQETYPFSNVSLSEFPGVSQIISLGNLSVIWGTFRYTPRRCTWEQYQAQVRNYSTAVYDIPGIYTQFGDLDQGIVYLYPIPNAVYAMEWTIRCLPSPLVSDTDPEVIPSQFQLAIPWYAAWIAACTQPGDDWQKRAQMFEQNYSKFLQRARAGAQPSMIPNWYGRGR